MTAAPQPFGRLATVLDRILCGITWTTQASAAATYLIITAQPAVWRPTLDTNPVGVICMWVFSICATTLWALSLWGERQRFYDRAIQRSCRRVGLICHLTALAIAALAAAGSPNRIPLWIVLGALSFAAITTWGSWMQTRLLPDEDQAVIDAVITREATQRASVHDANWREKRRDRLAAIATSLGYSLTDAPAGGQTEAPAARWQIPAGKHAPLVYFIRNGNRMKIGTTTELKRRIRTLALRPDNVALLVDGDRRRERDFHNQFADLRIGGTEWFAYEGALAAYIHDQTARLAQKGQKQ